MLASQARNLAYWLQPRRLPRFVRALSGLLRQKTRDAAASPAPMPGGFCGRALSLAPEYLMEVYAQGLYPANFMGLTTLWSPPFRAVLRPDHVGADCLSASLSAALDIRFDDDFEGVLAASARRDGAIWRNLALDLALGDLFDAGFAHCVEVRDREGHLVAGLAGVACGGVFTVETIFADDDMALSQAVVVLVLQLQSRDYALIDFKTPSSAPVLLHYDRMSRARFRRFVANRLGDGQSGTWRPEADPKGETVVAQRPNLPLQAA
jgi:leucyl/phenylalanyl-tRNA--protein transferase